MFMILPIGGASFADSAMVQESTAHPGDRKWFFLSYEKRNGKILPFQNMKRFSFLKHSVQEKTLVNNTGRYL